MDRHRRFHFNRKITLLFIALWLLPVSAADADTTSCPQHYAGGVTPVLINPSLAINTGEFCFTEYASFYSGQTRTPLYAVEHLTVERVQAARGDERRDTFHEEPRLQPQFRSTLDDYRRSGYDRGHLAASANMTEPDTMHESFSLVNIIPQHPSNNRRTWAGIERAVRNAAYDVNEIYVVTGVAFLGENPQALKGRVLVPTHVWKAIYIPDLDTASAYMTANVDDGGQWREVSIDQLTDLVGIDPFPIMDETVRATAVDLPDP